MKQMITWRERSMGSPADYEEAQKRILHVFRQYKFPDSIKILQFVIRVGDWGGCMIAESSDGIALHKLATMLPAFSFEVHQVMDIQDAVAAELEMMEWRASLK